MKLLDEIIDILSSEGGSIESALFKAQVLAHQIGDAELKKWVGNELKGYPDPESLPDYRVVAMAIKGDFHDNRTRYTSHSLPTFHLPDALKEQFSKSDVTQSIAVVEGWSKSPSAITIPLPPEFYPYLSKGLNGFHVDSAWGVHGEGAMLQIVVQVRSRLLDFALELSERFPTVADAADLRGPEASSEVSSMFQHTVFGNNTTIVVGSGQVGKIANEVHSNDFASLAKYLEQQGVATEDLAGLEKALAEDKAANPGIKEPGPNTRNWMGSMLAKAGTVAWKVSIDVGVKVLATGIAAYLIS